MPRRREVPHREPVPDPVYNSTLVSKFINCMMWDGKKSVSERIFYGAMDRIRDRTGEDPLPVFQRDREGLAIPFEQGGYQERGALDVEHRCFARIFLREGGAHGERRQFEVRADQRDGECARHFQADSARYAVVPDRGGRDGTENRGRYVIGMALDASSFVQQPVLVPT